MAVRTCDQEVNFIFHHVRGYDLVCVMALFRFEYDSEPGRHEIEDGIDFWGLERDGQLLGVMGIQDRGDLALLRHAYIRTQAQKRGVGTSLFQHLVNITEKHILIGTWAAASWALSFYEKHGYTTVSEEEKNRLLEKYWSIPERQIETSVVLASQSWRESGSSRSVDR